MSDHFPDHSLTSSSKIHKENKKFTIHKRVIRNTNLTAFKSDLCNVNWNSVNHLPERKSTWNIFYSLNQIKNTLPWRTFKAKDLQAPWIRKGLKKSSKQKQKLCIKFLKDKLIQNNKRETTKSVNTFLENSIKKLSKLTINLYWRIVKMTWNAQDK